MVQHRGDPAQRSSVAPQPFNLRERGLLFRGRLEVLTVVRDSGAERDVPDPSAWLRLCRSASRVLSPIASRSHWLAAPLTPAPGIQISSSNNRTGVGALSQTRDRNGCHDQDEASCRVNHDTHSFTSGGGRPCSREVLLPQKAEVDIFYLGRVGAAVNGIPVMRLDLLLPTDPRFVWILRLWFQFGVDRAIIAQGKRDFALPWLKA